MNYSKEFLFALEEASIRVASETDIPVEHVLKDYWITVALRALFESANDLGVKLIFKGGTSLSKGFHLIQRFSEDLDILVIAEGGPDAVQRILRKLHLAVEDAIGTPAIVDSTKSMTGEFRPARYVYPGQHSLPGAAPDGIRVELSTWGGALPFQICEITSIINDEARFPAATGPRTSKLLVPTLGPERTLIEKLVILHDAAMGNDVHRLRKTARHYYDIHQLLSDSEVASALTAVGAELLANEVFKHNTASKTRNSHRRPRGGFAQSPAFVETGPDRARDEYQRRVVPVLLFPTSSKPTFDECLQTVQRWSEIL